MYPGTQSFEPKLFQKDLSLSHLCDDTYSIDTYALS